jgi:hypothetical protein
MSERSIQDFLQALNTEESEMNDLEDQVLNADLGLTVPRIPLGQIARRAGSAAMRTMVAQRPPSSRRPASQAPQQKPPPAAPQARRKFCTRCGAPLETNTRFCTRCGAPR